MNLKRTVLAAVAAAVLVGGVIAQPYGPGMMQGPGGGYGWGPGGMMGGYGPGAGMMGGGWGPGIMGPGMMGGGWGPGMMGGWGGGYPSDLSADQRSKISEAQQDFQKKQWAVMQQMHSLMWSANAPGSAGAPFDEQAARKSYDQVAALQKQMFENSIEYRKRVDAVLTPQQREEMRRGGQR